MSAAALDQVMVEPDGSVCIVRTGSSIFSAVTNTVAL